MKVMNTRFGRQILNKNRSQIHLSPGIAASLWVSVFF